MTALMRAIASLGYIGFARPAPGTWGSLASLPLAYAVLLAGGVWLLIASTICMFFIGLYATVKVTHEDNHDPSWVVIDELVGQWIALFPVAYGASMMGVSYWQLYPGWISGFVLFRLFDIWKPWIIGRADRRGDALGVMLDDVLAGVFAALTSIALAGIAHGLLM